MNTDGSGRLIFVEESNILRGISRVGNYNTDVKNVLIGKKAIMEYSGLSEELYDKFRKNKPPLPVAIIDRRHYSTKDNIDKYFNSICWCDSSNIPDDGEDS